MKEALSHPIFEIIHQTALELNYPCEVIGGYVRDFLLFRQLGTEIDLVVEGDGIYFAKQLASKLKPSPQVVIFRNFGTAHFTYHGINIEVVGARKESYRDFSRNPIVSPATLYEDKLRRDFTINAIGISLGKNFGEISDPFNGVKDLENKILRTPNDPMVTLYEDPLRILRAVRFATRFKLVVEEKLLEAARQNAHRIKIVAPERINEELEKILSLPNPSRGFRLLDEIYLLHEILPELVDLKGVSTVEGYHHKDNFEHSLKVLDNVSRSSQKIALRWAALLHDIGKARTKQLDKEKGWTFHGHDAIGSRMVIDIFKRLHLSQEKTEYVSKLISLHLRPINLVDEGVTDSAIRRLIFDAGNELEDLFILVEADITSRNREKVKRYLQNFRILKERILEVEQKDRIRNFQPPVSGDEIMKLLHLPPGPTIGTLKKSIKDAILDGIIPNEKEAALNFLYEQAKKLGLMNGN
ncbi:MAG: CCA tRNA nucleotidyltransferase [Bacteroidales bacterium]|nr:CCA tRNA nucleotidyltransferase [Bacteroidales bacterium]